MQQTIGFKRFVLTHVGATALALGVLVSGGLAVAGIAASGNLPWASGAVAPVPARQTVDETQMSRFIDAKTAQVEEMDQHTAAVAARASAHEATLRFYRIKEENILAMPEQNHTSTEMEAAPSQQWTP